MITRYGPYGAGYLTKVRSISVHSPLTLSPIFSIALEGVDPSDAADRLVAKVVPLGQRFYPSECAFPLRKCSTLRLEKQARLLTYFCLMSFATPHTGHVANLLVRFALASDKALPAGWAPRTLIQCGVAYPEIWDILHGMYESQVCSFFPFVPSLCIILRTLFPSTREIADMLTSLRLSYVFTTPDPIRSIPRISPHLTISTFDPKYDRSPHLISSKTYKQCHVTSLCC
jgi:hypothetical protein